MTEPFYILVFLFILYLVSNAVPKSNTLATGLLGILQFVMFSGSLIHYWPY